MAGNGDPDPDAGGQRHAPFLNKPCPRRFEGQGQGGGSVALPAASEGDLVAFGLVKSVLEETPDQEVIKFVGIESGPIESGPGL